MCSCFFSIIIPVYNAEKYLRDCLLSIREQEFRDFEVICVDDGSKDDSLEVLKEFSCVDKRIRVFSQENKGVSAARNFAMKHIMGKFFMFVDADDVLLPDALHYYKKVFDEHLVDVLIESGVSFGDFEQPVAKNGSLSAVMHSMTAADYFIKNGLAGYAWGKVYRTATMGHLRFPEDMVMFEDLYMFIHLFDDNYSFIYYSGSHYGYRQHLSAATKNISGKGRLDVLFAYIAVLEYMKKNGYSNKEMLLLLPNIRFFVNWNEYHTLSSSERIGYAKRLGEISGLIGNDPRGVFMKIRVKLNGRFETILRFCEWLYYGTEMFFIKKILRKKAYGKRH